MGLFSRRGRPAAPPPIRWVRVAVALHQPEAEFLCAVLDDAGIPTLVGRTTFDVPDMLAGGPRAVMVPAEHESEARDLLHYDGPMHDDSGDER
ncbi:MAG: hypothetical protein RIB67_10290 [Miltoncostaeaceae bacterium]